MHSQCERFEYAYGSMCGVRFRGAGFAVLSRRIVLYISSAASCIASALSRAPFGMLYCPPGPVVRKLHAVKIIDRSTLSDEDNMAVAKEVNIMKEIQHPNIIKLIEVCMWY